MKEDITYILNYLQEKRKVYLMKENLFHFEMEKEQYIFQ